MTALEGTVDLDTLAKLAQAATPGPWRAGYEANNAHMDDAAVYAADCWVAITSIGVRADAAYIAAIDPQTTLALLARLRAAERVVEAARETSRAAHLAGLDFWAVPALTVALEGLRAALTETPE